MPYPSLIAITVSTEPSGPCLLSTDTEVSIAPKARAHTRADKPPTEHIVSSQANVKQTAIALRVLPAAIVSGLTPPVVSDVTLCVSPLTVEKLGTGLVRARVLRPPFTLSKPAAPTVTVAPNASATRILKPQEGGKENAPVAAADKDDAKWVLAKVYGDAAVPPGRAVCVGSPLVRAWDVIGCVPVRDSGSADI